MEKGKFILKTTYYGQFKSNSEEFGFNTIVIAGTCMAPDAKRIGRLVQVRKGAGAFGTDTVLLRLMDGGLQSFENEGFFSINKDYVDEINELFKSCELDTSDTEYSINGIWKATGFVVNGMDCTGGKVSFLTITKTNDGKTTIK
jgi:hypothetical protein